MRLRYLLTVMVLLAGPAVHAHPDVEAARKAYKKGEFAKALNALERGERSLTRTDDDTVEILWIKGATLHAMGKTKGADEAFDALIAVRPLHEPEKWDASPDLRARFDARVVAYKKDKAVLLGEPGLDGFTLLVPVERFPERIHTLTAYVRAKGEASFQPHALQLRADLAEVDLRDEALWRQAAQVGALELVVEAVNPRGVPIARLGSATQPHPLPVTPANADRIIASLRPAPARQPPSEPASTTVATPAPAAAPAATSQPAPPARDNAAPATREVRASGEEKPAAPAAAAEPAAPAGQGGMRVPVLGWAGFGLGGLLLGAALLAVLGAGAGLGVFAASYFYVTRVGGNHRILGGDVGRTALVNVTLWIGPALLGLAMVLAVAGAAGLGLGGVITLLGMRS